jgi:predicted metal-binding membrane protein
MHALKVTDDNDQEQARSTSRRRAPVFWLWLVVVAAWTLALLAALTNQSFLINHYYLLEQSHLPWLVALVIFLACWQVMTVGMMLPSSMPMVYMMVHASRQQRHMRMIQAAFLAAYALVWTAFALITFLGDTQIHRLVNSWSWLAQHPWLIGAATFALAGGFQFSPLKEHCLRQCRSPFSFFVRYYRKGVGGAWRLGLRHGAFCLGCCWALMLVMFGLGMSSLAWMAVLTGVMVAEKTYPGGQRLSPIIGFALLLLAVLWLVHPAWLSLGGV